MKSHQPPFTINFTGFLLVLIAAFARFYSIQALGAYHSIQIEIRENHPLISHGSYRLLRNPYYFSNPIEVSGFPLIVSSLAGTLLGCLLCWPCLYLRLVLEGRALLKTIRRRFFEYMRCLPRFFPVPYELK
jgi:protein-S-isoprenylcysteine O-methyltransferase Ste14